MNAIIQWIGSIIARNIESGSSRGAIWGAILGATLLGGVALAGWITGGTGYMGGGLTLAGTLLGAVVGGLIGANLGPQDRLIKSDRQRVIRIYDYNRKMVAVVPFVGCMVLSLAAFSVYPSEPPGDDKDALLAVGIGCAALSLASVVYLMFQNIAVSLGEQVVIHRPFDKFTFDYNEVIRGGIRPISRKTNNAQTHWFYSEVAEMKIEIPIGKRQADDMSLLFEGGVIA